MDGCEGTGVCAVAMFVYGLCKDGEAEEEARRDCGVSDLWELVASPLGNSLVRIRRHL